MTIIFSYLQTGQILNWNALKLFLAVAQTRTLTGAAALLGMSHSTVYRRLNEFEQEVGRLFERLNGIYELTELGEEILIHAQRVSSSFEDIERHLAGKDTQPKGIVRVTAPTSFSYRCLPNHIAELHELYPEIEIELLVTNLELNMTNRYADIAIRVTPTPPEHLVGRQIRYIKWGVYASKQYIAKHGHAANTNDLAHHRLIGAAGALRTHSAFTWLDNKHHLNIGSRSDDFVAMACLAEASQGLALLPDDLAKPELVRLFTFTPQSENQLWILTHPDLRNVERIKLVMQYLTKALAT